MANNKKSFILYCDILSTIEKLPDETAGKLFKHLLDYVNDKNPISDDLLINIAFEPIKQSLKRDLVKFEIRCETARINGLKGGRPKNPDKANKTQKTQSVISEPRKADSDSDSDSDKDQKNIRDISKNRNDHQLPPKKIIPFKKIVDLYHELLPTLPKQEKLTKKREGYIRQRWIEDLPAITNWENYFDYVSRSDFLMGRTESRDHRPPFRATLEWLTNPSNFAKVYEEKYHGVQ